MTWLRAAVFATALIRPGAIRGGEIDPIRFKDLARRSVNILETYDGYREAFEEKRAKRYDSASGRLVNRKNTFLLFVETNPMVPGLDGEKVDNGTVLRTNAGEVHGFVQKTYAAANFSYFFPEYEAGIYAIGDLMQLLMSEEDNPGLEYLFKGVPSDGALSFSAGYLVVSGFLDKGVRGLDLGGLLRYEPLTYRDSLTGRERFLLARQSDGTYEGSRIRTELFARYHDERYDVNTLFSLRSGLELIGLGLSHPLPYGFELEPFLRYSDYKTRFQAGAGVRSTRFHRLDSEIEFANDVHRNTAGRFEYFHHLIIRNKLVFFRTRREEMAGFSRYDFFMTLNHAYSVSTDILEERVTGHGGGIALENICGFLSLFLGGGYNEYRYLSVLPFKDGYAIELKAQIGW